MSSPTKISASPVGVREGQRVILREITASLHNSPPLMALNNKNVNDDVLKSPSEHEVKVKFAREFGDVANYPPPPSIVIEPNSISSASSFQSLTSTLSTKSTSGICVDSPTRSSDASYADFDVSGLDDLISACAAIHLGETTAVTGEQSFADATFASATDEFDVTRDLSKSRSISPNIDFNDTHIIHTNLNATEVLCGQESHNLNTTQEINSQKIYNICEQDAYVKALTEPHISPDYATASDTFLQSIPQFGDVGSDNQELNNIFAVPLPPEDFIRPIEPPPPAATASVEVDNSQIQQLTENASGISSCSQSSTLPTLSSILLKAESALSSPLLTKNENTYLESPQNYLETPPIAPIVSLSFANIDQSIPDASTNLPTAINEPSFIESQHFLDITKPYLLFEPTAQSDIVVPETSKNDCDNSFSQFEQEKSELFTDVAIKEPISEDINNQLNPSVETSDENHIQTETESPIVVNLEKDVFTANHEDLDATVNIHDITTNLFDATQAEYNEELETDNSNTNIETIVPPQVEYNNFLPQRQSTSLNGLLPPLNSNEELSPVKSTGTVEPEFFDAQNTSITDQQIDLESIKLDEENIANGIHNTSLELVDNNDHLVSVSSDLWRDPTNFDFLLSKKANSATTDRLRAESLYVKFDPLVADTNMLPQGNGATASPNEERNGEKETAVPNIGTPKRNPAIAAIDRLLFYSPMSLGNQKSEEPEKIEPTEKTTPEPAPVVDLVMAKELELVRTTVLQLEEQLENQKLEQEQQEKEHKVDREAFQEAITQLQKQLNQEIKSKNQINVVVDEYEKSISRLVAERERDRKNLDVEKASLLEELQEVKNHLSASEAAFNDVHAKYERLKVVVTASKNNEAVLKASIAENVEIIKTLEDRYDQIKTHAAVRLEKANLELEGIRKQHESETLKLRAMLRKEELKSSSLAEMIEQKTKENKELTKILDEVIARVDSGGDK